MDIIIEIVGEAVGALIELLLESERVPKAARVVIACMLLLPITGLCTVIAVMADGLPLKIFLIAVAVLMLLGLARIITKIIRH